MVFMPLVVIYCFAGAGGGAIHTDLLERAHCPINHDCTWTYPYYITQSLKCSSNRQCPNGFACCRDCHYLHRVCKAALWLPQTHQQEAFDPKTKKQCPNTSSVFCLHKFPYVGTEKYKCTTDNDCDYGFACCDDFCYNHKICKEPISADQLVENANVCPEDAKICLRPSSYEKTTKYRCETHGDCPKSLACCFDGCFAHKICKPRQTTQESYDVCPLSIRRKSCVNINRNLTKYSCSNRNDCVFGYVCCEDNCYDHKVCKLPIGAFSYREVYKPKNVTVENLEPNHQCPQIEEKCLKPYSLRLAKKFICSKDEDCQLGQLCCKDSCVKDFKICKNVFDVKIDVRSGNGLAGNTTTSSVSLDTPTETTKETHGQPISVQSSLKHVSSSTKRTTSLENDHVYSPTFNTKTTVLAASEEETPKFNGVTEEKPSVFLVPTASTTKVMVTTDVFSHITENEFQSPNTGNWKTPSLLLDANKEDLEGNSTTTKTCQTFCATTLNPDMITSNYEEQDKSSSKIPITTLGTICGKHKSKKQQQDGCLLKLYKAGNTDVEFYFDELEEPEIDQGSGSGYEDDEDIF